MDDNLRQLYQEIILEHSKSPRNFGELQCANTCAKGHNKMCGDKLIVCMYLDNDQKIKDISFKGSGCAISMASASLMTEIVKGKNIEEAKEIFANFHNMVTDQKLINNHNHDDIERLEVLSGVKNFPTRVKCATLAWHTMDAAIKNKNNQDSEITTEQ